MRIRCIPLFQYTGSPIHQGLSLPRRSMQTTILWSRAGSATENRYGRSAIQARAGLRREAQAPGLPLSAPVFAGFDSIGLSVHSVDATYKGILLPSRKKPGFAPLTEAIDLSFIRVAPTKGGE